MQGAGTLIEIVISILHFCSWALPMFHAQSIMPIVVFKNLGPPSPPLEPVCRPTPSAAVDESLDPPDCACQAGIWLCHWGGPRPIPSRKARKVRYLFLEGDPAHPCPSRSLSRSCSFIMCSPISGRKTLHGGRHLWGSSVPRNILSGLHGQVCRQAGVQCRISKAATALPCPLTRAGFGLAIPAGPFYLMGLILRFFFSLLNLCQRGRQGSIE